VKGRVDAGYRDIPPKAMLGRRIGLRRRKGRGNDSGAVGPSSTKIVAVIA
jgi:hypothetical protein